MKCKKCGHIFDKGEEKIRYNVSECFGHTVKEEYPICPVCDSDYVEETTPCAVCGAEHTDDELDGGVCADCIDAFQYDVKGCFDLCDNTRTRTEIELNSFLAFYYSAEEIEEMLLRDLTKARDDGDFDCKDFINNSRYDFGEMLRADKKGK